MYRAFMKLQEYFVVLLGKTYRLGNGTKIALCLVI